MRKERGIFITFEGGEGSGKSTQARLLHEHLAAAGRESLLTREPGGTPLGDRVRAILLDPATGEIDPLSELFLYQAARREHVRRVVLPALGRGVIVISDRFADASVAYQSFGRGLDASLVERLNRLSCGGLEPDVTFLLDLGGSGVGLERALARGGQRDELRFECEGDLFHRQVRRGYLSLARRNPGRFELLDGTGSVEDVHARVLERLEARCAGGLAWS